MPSLEDVGRSFIDAFNRRDADGIVALCHPEIDFSPTGIATCGRRQTYRGHDGLREWVRVLVEGGSAHQAAVVKTRVLGDDRFVIFAETMLDGEVISPSAMVAEMRDGLIVEACAYLSTEGDLIRVGVIPA